MQIKNTHFFQTTEELEFSWYISADGYKLGSDKLSLPPIKPQSSYVVDWQSGPWYSLWHSSSSEEIFLTITAKLLNPTRWVEAGHIVTTAQVQLPSKRDTVPHVRISLLSMFLFLFSLQLIIRKYRSNIFLTILFCNF